MKTHMIDTQTWPRSWCRLMAILFLGSALCPLTAPAQVPLEFNYQGRLTDAQGVPIPGPVNANFKVFKGGTAAEVPSTGTLVYQEAATLTADANGVFSHRIGSLAALDHPVFTDGDEARFIEVSIEGPGGTEVLLPRRQVVSVPYALDAVGVVPVGAVLSWWGNVADIPPGFELCDGNPPTTPGATLVGNKPNLLDKFIKGAEASDSVKGDLNNGGAHSRSHLHSHAHTHGLNGHTHTMSHIHSCSQLRAAIYFDSTGESFWLHEQPTDIPDIVHTYVYAEGSPKLVQASGTRSGPETQSTAVFGFTDASSRSSTLGNSGTSAGASTANTSSTSVDNRPAFQELFNIIRVK